MLYFLDTYGSNALPFQIIREEEEEPYNIHKDRIEPGGRIVDKISLVGATFAVGKTNFFGIGPRLQVPKM